MKPKTRAQASPAPAQALAQRYAQARAATEALAAPLSPEDCQAQSMPDASPVKWHLAHVTWFIETLVLERFEPACGLDFKPFDASFRVLFNSYYNAVGPKHPRPQRGLLTRPSQSTVLQWRADVDARLPAVLAHAPHLPPAQAQALAGLVELGIQHEQQHQELILTDLKHLFAQNAQLPVYAPRWPLAPVATAAAAWVAFEGGLTDIGTGQGDGALQTGDGFHFDNEAPRHRTYLRPYRLMNRLVTHGEWLEFVDDGAYRDPRWWLSAGWDWVQSEGIQAPLYWFRQSQGAWQTFTLHGPVPLDPHTPIVHISHYEADAFARWRAATHASARGARLPTEAEWEAAVAPDFHQHLAHGNLLESKALHPMPVRSGDTGCLLQAVGDVWQWTSSSYAPYPGYRPWEGAVGEYNGKFMANQTVLRGGSCVTPASHLRASYRNFFPSTARWQFSGLRLAADC